MATYYRRQANPATAPFQVLLGIVTINPAQRAVVGDVIDLSPAESAPMVASGIVASFGSSTAGFVQTPQSPF